MHLTNKQARRFLLAYQGLRPPYGFQGKAGIMEFIHRVGCVQFDPLNIVGHNHELALQARVDGFRPWMLQELLYQERSLVDGFDKMMSIYPVEDWPYFRRRRDAIRDRDGRSAMEVRAVLPQVRAALEERGPLSSLDLELGEMVEWDWSRSRLARAALESMYFWGELVIHHKVHTRKAYDYAHRWLPAEILQAPDPNETEERYQEWYVLRRIGNIGMLWGRSGDAWLGMYAIQSPERKAALSRLLEHGEVVLVQVDDIKEPFYARRQELPWLELAQVEDDTPPQATVIAPLDNIMWDRRMLKALFDFDYRWEVYVPEGKRRYGYYVLPVLYGDRFVARFEPGMDKRRKVFRIKNWWWEADIAPSEELQVALADCFRRFLQYLGMPRLEVQEGTGLDWLAAAAEG